MKSSRVVATAVALAAAAFLTFAGFPKAEAQVVQMKFAHYAEETHPAHLAAKQFAAKVKNAQKVR